MKLWSRPRKPSGEEGTVAIEPMKTEAILTQTVEQLERLNETLAALRRELLPGQPRKFALLAESPLEDMRRLQAEIEQFTAELASTPAGA